MQKGKQTKNVPQLPGLPAWGVSTLCAEGGNLAVAQLPSKSWEQRREITQTHPTEVTWQCPPEDVAVRKGIYPKNL